MPRGEPQTPDSVLEVAPRIVPWISLRSAWERLAEPARPQAESHFAMVPSTGLQAGHSLTPVPPALEAEEPPASTTSPSRQFEGNAATFTSIGDGRVYDQPHGPLIIGEVFGNVFTGTNNGRITQTVNVLDPHPNLPAHPDVSSHLSDYFPDSRADDEAHILQWIDSDSPAELILCVLGKVGVGKSTLAKHLATRLRQDKRLAANIFFSFALPDWSPESIIRMIAGQLCGAYRGLTRVVSEALRLDVDPSVPLETRIQHLIVEPVRSLRLARPLVVVLDALDQWAPHPILVKALTCLTSNTHLIRFIILGRPGMEDRLQNVSFRIHNLLGVSGCVMRHYFRERFNGVRWEYGRKPSDETIDRLVNKADGLFIWSSTLCSLLEDKMSYPNPHDTIDAILQSQQSVGNNDILANLYHGAINARFPKPDHKAKLKVFLGAVLVLQEPLPVAAFASLVSLAAPVIRQILANLRPLQVGQSDDTQDMVYPASSTFHLSFLEYLQRPETPSHLTFPINTFISHSRIAKACLEDLRHLSPTPQPPFISPLQKYVIKFWPIHIAHGTPTVSPTSDDKWKATSHSAILDGFSLLQWQNWASSYLQLIDPQAVPTFHEMLAHEALGTRTHSPLEFISHAARLLLQERVIKGTPNAIAVAEVVVRLQHRSSDAWCDLGMACYNVAEVMASISLVESAVQACRCATDLGGEGDHLASGALARCLLMRFGFLGSREDLDEAISLGRAVLLSTPLGDAHRARSLNNLACSLDRRFGLTGAAHDLHEAMVLHREALLLQPERQPNRASSLNNLAVCLTKQYQGTGDTRSLDEAIELRQEALLIWLPGDPGRAWALDGLAINLLDRFNDTGSCESLDKAIVLCREALLLRPSGHPDRPRVLNNLARTISVHFDHTGNPRSLEETLMLHREALALRPSGHPDRAWSLDNLATTLYSYYEQTGKRGHLDEAITLLREALPLRPSGHPQRTMSLNNLATSLLCSFRLSGDTESLDKAIMLLREALFLFPPTHRDRPASLFNLADCLQSHFEMTGNTEPLSEASMLHREALLQFPPGHPHRAKSLNNLAAALYSQFELTGNSDLLDEAVMLIRESLSLAPPGHQDRASSLHNLAYCLQSHFRLRGTPESQDEAVVHCREALPLLPPGHPLRLSTLRLLADSLLSHYAVTGSTENLHEAIVLHREALSLLASDHPDRAGVLNGLAVAVYFSFQLTGNIENLDDSILLNQEALSLRPSGHPHRAISLSNLASSLQARFKLTGSAETLDRVIVFYREALVLRPPGHPRHKASLIDLAVALELSHKLTGDVQSLSEAESLRHLAIEAAVPCPTRPTVGTDPDRDSDVD